MIRLSWFPRTERIAREPRERMKAMVSQLFGPLLTRSPQQMTSVLSAVTLASLSSVWNSSRQPWMSPTIKRRRPSSSSSLITQCDTAGTGISGRVHDILCNTNYSQPTALIMSFYKCKIMHVREPVVSRASQRHSSAMNNSQS